MSREETLQAMKDIRSQYGDDAIVEFSVILSVEELEKWLPMESMRKSTWREWTVPEIEMVVTNRLEYAMIGVENRVPKRRNMYAAGNRRNRF